MALELRQKRILIKKKIKCSIQGGWGVNILEDEKNGVEERSARARDCEKTGSAKCQL
jgi:hypothetical protein